VVATYMAEVEVFSPRKLQKALTLTDAEIENEEVMANLGVVEILPNNLDKFRFIYLLLRFHVF